MWAWLASPHLAEAGGKLEALVKDSTYRAEGREGGREAGVGREGGREGFASSLHILGRGKC